MVRWIVVVWLTLVSMSAMAAPIDSFKFDTQYDEDRFKRLIEEIRCVKCQNTSIAGSNADLARDHRTKVYEMMKQGKSDMEIRQWFVARYGDFVLYRPQVDSRTWLLWGLPLLLIPVGGVMLWMQIRRQRRNDTDAGDEKGSQVDVGLSDEEQQRLAEVLKK